MVNNENFTRIGRWVSIIYRYGQIYWDKKLSPYDIGTGQFMFLLKLFEIDGLNQHELAEYLNIDKGTTARALVKLEREGYISRENNTDDRRFKKVFLTDKACKIKSEMFSISESWTEILTEGFSEEEKNQTFVLLMKMAHNAAKFTK